MNNLATNTWKSYNTPQQFMQGEGNNCPPGQFGFSYVIQSVDKDGKPDGQARTHYDYAALMITLKQNEWIHQSEENIKKEVIQVNKPGWKVEPESFKFRY